MQRSGAGLAPPEQTCPIKLASGAKKAIQSQALSEKPRAIYQPSFTFQTQLPIEVVAVRVLENNNESKHPFGIAGAQGGHDASVH